MSKLLNTKRARHSLGANWTEPTLRRVFSPQFPASDERIGAEMDCVLQSLSSVSPESEVYQHVSCKYLVWVFLHQEVCTDRINTADVNLIYFSLGIAKAFITFANAVSSLVQSIVGKCSKYRLFKIVWCKIAFTLHFQWIINVGNSRDTYISKTSYIRREKVKAVT